MCITKSTPFLNSRKTLIFLMSKVITLETHHVNRLRDILKETGMSEFLWTNWWLPDAVRTLFSSHQLPCRLFGCDSAYIFHRPGNPMTKLAHSGYRLELYSSYSAWISCSGCDSVVWAAQGTWREVLVPVWKAKVVRYRGSRHYGFIRSPSKQNAIKLPSYWTKWRHLFMFSLAVEVQEK